MFAPAFGIPEDPAPGGASGPLDTYLVHHGAVSPDGIAQMVSLQGVKMGRPSRVHISISSSASSKDGDITSVQVGGAAVLVAEVRCICRADRRYTLFQALGFGLWALWPI